MSKFRLLIGVPRLGSYLLETILIQGTARDLACVGLDRFLGVPQEM